MSEEKDEPKKPKELRTFGSIIKRGKYLHIKYVVNGKPYQKSTKSNSMKKAERMLLDIQVGLKGGTFSPGSGRLTLADLKALVVANYKANGRRSLDRMEYSWKHVTKKFGDDARADVIPPEVPAYIAERLEQGAMPSTVKKEIAALQRGFSLAFQQRRISAMPYIETLAVSNTRKGFLTREQLDAILAQMGRVSARQISSRHAIRPTLFAYLTGWRLGEVLGLKWEQVDTKAGMVRLEPGETKNDEGRTFPFRAVPELEQLLKDQRAETSAWELEHPGQKVEHVFWCARDGVARPIKSVRHSWNTACRKAGLVPGRKAAKGKVFHDMRRSASRNMTQAGIPQPVVMALLGHKTDAMFRRYNIVDEGDLAEQVAKLAKVEKAR